jgi:competence protein ComEA
VKAYSREQLTVILWILVFAFPFSLITLCNRLSETPSTYNAPLQVMYELRGDVTKQGFYFFSQEQSIPELVQAAGGLKQGRLNQPDASSVVSKSKKIIFSADASNLSRWEIKELDAAARMNFFMPIQINTASAVDLTLIPGIGFRIAESIVHYRETHKGIRRLEDLQAIPGIGEKKMQSIIPYITTLLYSETPKN